MPKKPMKIKTPRKPIITKAKLLTRIKELEEEITWGKRIVALGQEEITRLMKLNDSLTTSINNMSRWDRS